MPLLAKDKDFHHFPFGLLSIAAKLEKLGIEYTIFDERVSSDQDFELIAKSYDIVGISIFTGYQTYRGHHWLTMVRRLNPEAITIVGGPHATAMPEQTVASSLVDYVIAGYADDAFANLANNILRAKTRQSKLAFSMPQVHSKRGKDIIGMPTPKKYIDLDWSPLPYHKINLDSYINPKTKRVMYVSQYGCPAPCTFCATPETRKWTAKPLELVYQDLDTLDSLTNFQELCFFDATLFTIRKRTMELVEHLNKRFPGRQWLADARAMELIKYSDEDFKALRSCAAELKMLIVGLESGSEYFAEKVIKKGKGHLTNFMEVAKRTHNAGIHLTSGVVFGFPGEKLSDLEATRKYVTEVRKVNPGFRISTTFFKPLPGTELFDLVKKLGYVNINSFEEWAEAGDSTHYDYNSWSDPAWFSDEENKAYKKGYEDFMQEHGSICI